MAVGSASPSSSTHPIWDDDALCDSSPLVQLGRNLSVARHTGGNVGFTIGYFAAALACTMLCLVLWLACKSRYQHTRVRPTAFVALMCASSVCQMLFSCLQVILNNHYPCYWGPILLIPIIPLAAVTIIGRLILFVCLSQYSTAVSDKLKNRRGDPELDHSPVLPQSNVSVSSSSRGGGGGSKPLSTVSELDATELLPPPSPQQQQQRRWWTAAVPQRQRCGRWAGGRWSYVCTCAHLALVLKRIVHSTAKIQNEEELAVLKFLITTPGILLMAVIFTSPVLVAVVLFLVLSEDREVYYHCTNCDLSVAVFALTAGFLLFFVIIGFINWLLVRRYVSTTTTTTTMHHDDVWGLKTETMHSLCACAVVLTGLVLAMFDPTLHYPYSHLFLLTTGMVMLVASQSVWQLILGWRAERELAISSSSTAATSSSRTSAVRFAGTAARIDLAFLNLVLQNADFCAEFEVESLYFVKDAREWRSRYFSIGATARLARARRIYKAYVSDSGLYTVNISSRTKDALQRELDAANTAVVQYTLFDAALGEISAMLITGALIRFYQTRTSTLCASSSRPGRWSLTGMTSTSSPSRPATAASSAAHDVDNAIIQV